MKGYDRDDRMVHASSPHMDVVRYDRAGKWYLEPKNGGKRQHITVKQAAEYAKWAVNLDNGWINSGLYGGSVFDRLTSGVY